MIFYHILYLIRDIVIEEDESMLQINGKNTVVTYSDWTNGRWLNCCWPSPGQSFLASVSSKSMTKIYILS
jgi:hypothetical protein